MKSARAKVCVPVCVRHASEVRDGIHRAANIADFVEVRFDCLDQSDQDLLREEVIRYSTGKPLILTNRSQDQGGHSKLSHEARIRFWSALQTLPEGWLADIEFDLVNEFASTDSQTRLGVDWKNIVCSYHHFNGTPEDLETIYGRMATTPARILKIAVTANDATDCLPVFRLLERSQREGRDLIAIAMDSAGIITRVLGPSRGSFLTFASLDDEGATAPGQLTARELRYMYRLDQIDRETQIMGIIGDPVSHSLSPHIHNAAFAAAGLNAVYLPFHVRNAEPFIKRMVHPKSRELDWNLRGLSITAPHKSSVTEWLDSVEPDAREMGAVNTIVVQDGELRGFNTDMIGFALSLQAEFSSLKDARCAVIGSGGGARAILRAFQSEGAHCELFARESNRSRQLADQLNLESHSLASAEFNQFDIVVNTTPLGTRGELQPETVATAEQLRGVRLAYDLVYNPLETRFLSEARAAGCRTLNGLGMLLAQAAEQFKLWTGKEPDMEVMRAAALRAIT